MSDSPQEGFLQALYRFFRSLRLAVVLILVLTVFSVVATLIPQGRETAFYLARYPVFGAIWLSLGFTTMFTSFLFLLPAGLFFANLAVCTVYRLISRWNHKRRRHGPDILHISLLVLLVGALITFTGRTEETVYLRVGQSLDLQDDYTLKLDDFQFERYDDGSPKDWLSMLTVERQGEVVKEGAVVQVNTPLKIGNLKFYQSNYGLDEGIVLTDIEGDRYWLTADDVIPLPDGDGLVVRSITPGFNGADNVVMFEVYTGHEITGQRVEMAGAPVGQWVISEVVSKHYTGLQMVYDPGYLTVLIGLILLTIGLFLTYIQKLGDNQV